MKLRVLPLAFVAVLAWSCKEKTTEELKPESIKELFADDFLIGTALNNRQIDASPDQADLIAKEFNVLTAENVMKSMLIHPSPDSFNFEYPDKLFALAEKNGQKVHGHTLVWHSQLSPFINEIEDSTAMAEALKAHIEAVAGRYKGKVYSWDVVNEAVEGDGSLRQSVFLKTMGEGYLPFAFKQAALVEPDADLYYNDYSMTGKAKRDGVIKMVKMIQESGAKIDGIGMQGHWHLDSPSLQEIEESIIAYSDLGVKVAITELDIDVLPSPQGVSGAEISQSAELKAELDPYTDGLPEDVSTALAKRYAEIFALFFKHRDKIDRVTFWGVNDGDSWKNGFPVRGRTNYPLLFDRNNGRKAAYEAIMDIER
ncbi:endo-1,4-beta-xylanase [Jiulongibacter sediminis]|uniref:Beta-xylanase n=1 Tax=Jiulongibacter sediminis TaxID=1605367 RepID=A0A0P7BYQ8_9BACT|nr:endo-1,4-beta-xylanase [Jiulongibacter sediminis]KPM49642.1 1,4-beta-xylanase [Jiulongibacter sediminis]TBX26680.1 1,4-beta-xylanase [Jiulongibacter sediminis]